MRFLPTKIHGFVDYFVGLLMIAAPWLFHFARGGAETWVFVINGLGALIYSLLTDYELGAVHKLSMRTHLTLDFIAGLVLAASPWIFSFADYVYAPHLIFGLFEIMASLITKREPSYETGHHTTMTAH